MRTNFDINVLFVMIKDKYSSWTIENMIYTTKRPVWFILPKDQYAPLGNKMFREIVEITIRAKCAPLIAAILNSAMNVNSLTQTFKLLTD